MTVAELLLALADVDDRGLYFEDDFVSWRDHVTLSRQRVDVLGPLRSEPTTPCGRAAGERPTVQLSVRRGSPGRDSCSSVFNTTRRGQALAADVERSDCQVILVSDATEHLYAADSGVRVINIDRPEWAELLCGRPSDDSASAAAPDDLLMLIFTSGTTGDPKAVRCNQRKFADLE